MTPPIDTGTIEVRVRYAETDAMGVLHHSRFWVYFEMGRTELLRAQGFDYADLEKQGVFFVVAKCAARYLVPARYDEVLELTTKVSRMGMARIDHTYELRRKDPSGPGQGMLLATAETTLACVNRQGQMIAIPEAIRGRNE
ncbi:MAG: thioesterase family protein [Planctomycetota bacterium]|nr:thioesterase family protein [Planctomycetota bacterium]